MRHISIRAELHHDKMVALLTVTSQSHYGKEFNMDPGPGRFEVNVGDCTVRLVSCPMISDEEAEELTPPAYIFSSADQIELYINGEHGKDLCENVPIDPKDWPKIKAAVLAYNEMYREEP